MRMWNRCFWMLPLVVVSTIGGPARADVEEQLFRIRRGTSVGFMNAQGATVIEPRFAWAEPFSEGRAPVRLNTRFGYIDRNGFLAVPAQYEYGQDFHEGKAWVKEGVSWILIDRSGKRIAATTFDEVKPFSEGRSAVRSVAGWGFVDTNANVVVPLQYRDVYSFTEDLAAVKGPDGYHYITRNGETAIAGPFSVGGPFQDGLAKVHTAPPYMVGYIDRQGQYVIQPRGGWLSIRASDQIRAMYGERDETGLPKILFFNVSGRLMFSFEGSDFGPFKDGRAVVRAKGRRLIIDTSGSVLGEIPLSYDFDGYSDGYARIMEKGSHGVERWGFVDRDGNVAIPLQFDYVEGFSHGLALVHEGAQYYVQNLSEERQQVLWIEGGHWKYIDHHGGVVWKCPTESCIYFDRIHSWTTKSGRGRYEAISWNERPILVEHGKIPYGAADLKPHSSFFSE